MIIDEKAFEHAWDTLMLMDKVGKTALRQTIEAYETAKGEQHKGVCKFCGRKCGCQSSDQPVDILLGDFEVESRAFPAVYNEEKDEVLLSGQEYRRLCAVYRAARDRKRESVAQWQPIETAPKDGSPIIVFTANKDTVISAFYLGKWLIESEEYWPVEPTHWMSIPKPPKSDSIEVEESK